VLGSLVPAPGSDPFDRPFGETGLVLARVRTAIRVHGIVQGVGFRPFVYSLATCLDLGGLVGNDADGVFAEVEGTPEAVQEFLIALRRDAPPLASIDQISTKPMLPTGASEFVIAPSEPGRERSTLVAADAATCDDCLAELDDPGDRRFGYPFINCVNCGPRFTIIRNVPYDRPLTTMAAFTMCEACAAEYHDPANRRFHAQPTSCPACGPRLRLAGHTTSRLSETRISDTRISETGGSWRAIAAAGQLLKDGQIVAVKGLGGYHLAADATSQEAASALRSRKHREDKPFAVMVAGLDEARQLCVVDDTAAALLTSRRRPIVLLPRHADTSIAKAVAPANRQLGIVLAYTPLHHLLLRDVARPIVLTSGNVSDEPIAYADDDALTRLGGIADAFLLHDRAIHIRADDSVVRAVRGRASLIRRARGYAPEPLHIRPAFTRPTLACGAEMKSTFCLAKGNYAVISQHIGDLENVETLRSFTEGIEHFMRLFDIEPQLVAHDLHPDYLSTKHAQELGLELVGVQHHHAHIASCLADNGETGPVIGVAFDGTGYGTDGTIWGGEFLIADLATMRRAGHLAPVPMPGGAAAIRQPWRMAAAYLDAAYPDGPPATHATQDVRRRNAPAWDAVTAMARRGINAPLTSSAGRLFDAVAALLGVRDLVNYEGQAAIELEQLACPQESGSYPARTSGGDVLTIHGTDLVRAITDDIAAGVGADLVAARFHNSLADLIVTTCEALRERSGLRTVALSGGVFQNSRLIHSVVGQLEERSFSVLTHSRVPCNDGGISLGQAVIAAARDRLGATDQGVVGAARNLSASRTTDPRPRQ
jgi:hydrogenase maturation protein HypF